MINEWIGLRLCPTEFKQTQSDMNKYITFLYKFAERKRYHQKRIPEIYPGPSLLVWKLPTRNVPHIKVVFQ